MTQHLVEKCKTICEIVMQEAKMTWIDMNKILLVGGMTRMPMVREMIAQARFRSAGRRRESGRSRRGRRRHSGVLSLLNEEEATGEKMLPDETRQQFSSREGGLIQVTQYYLAHPRGGALG